MISVGKQRLEENFSTTIRYQKSFKLMVFQMLQEVHLYAVKVKKIRAVKIFIVVLKSSRNNGFAQIPSQIQLMHFISVHSRERNVDHFQILNSLNKEKMEQFTSKIWIKVKHVFTM